MYRVELVATRLKNVNFSHRDGVFSVFFAAKMLYECHSHEKHETRGKTFCDDAIKSMQMHPPSMEIRI